jgi:hypothetical protein
MKPALDVFKMLDQAVKNVPKIVEEFLALPRLFKKGEGVDFGQEEVEPNDDNRPRPNAGR